MSWKRWLAIGAVIVLFIGGKAWILRHPKGAFAVILGAFLLIVSEPAEVG